MHAINLRVTCDCDAEVYYGLSLCLAGHHLWSLLPVPACCDEASLQLFLIVIAKFPHDGCCSFYQGRRFHLNAKDMEWFYSHYKHYDLLNFSLGCCRNATEINGPVKRQLEFGHFGNSLCISQRSSDAAEYSIMHLDQFVDGFWWHVRSVGKGHIVVMRGISVCYENEQFVGKYSLSHRSSGVRPDDNSSIELDSKDGRLTKKN